MNASTTQIALAWLLHRAQVMLPIPGTSSREHLEANIAAAEVALADRDLVLLDRIGR